MTRSDKEQIVARLTDQIQKAQSMFFADFKGITVEEVNSLRRECFKAGVKYTVAKNTLIARAMEGMSFSDSLKTHLAGPTAIAMGYDDAVAPAKILKKFSDKTNKLPVKAFMFENQVFDGKQFARIAALPPKPEVVASILGSLQSPIASIVYFLDALEKKLQPSAA